MFDLDAAAQAAYQFLRRHEGRMSAAKLAKLVYLAERKSISDSCTPITGDSFLALKTGPVPERLYALSRGEGEAQEQKRWDALFARDGGDVVALKELPANWLSELELGIISSVDSRFGRMSAEELSEWTHSPQNCPEWKMPQGDAAPISIEEVMRGLGFDDEEMELAAEELALFEAAQKSWQLLRNGE